MLHTCTSFVFGSPMLGDMDACMSVRYVQLWKRPLWKSAALKRLGEEKFCKLQDVGEYIAIFLHLYKTFIAIGISEYLSEIICH